jgi:rubrerythrin
LPERWRKPAEILDVRQAEDQGIWLPDGRVQGAVELTLGEETVDRLRAGYLCAKCFEPFEQAWPERCPVCGAPIRTEQAEYFAKEFAGEVDLGGSISTELDDLSERHARGDL